MTRRIVIRQTYSRCWQADGYPSKKTYNVTEASGNRLMGICNANADYNVRHYAYGDRVGLEIDRYKEVR